MEIFRSPAALRERCDRARAAGARVGFVPTMGALHDGHLSLVAAANAVGADFRCVSIFVNPTQFAPHEDLDAYPRTFEADCRHCEQANVDVVFAPTPEAIYPVGESTFVQVDGLTQELEGAFRPTHFRGVTTVVAKLFAAVGPCVAAFGRKDYQQYKVLTRMVKDLLLPVELVGAPIVRDADGLALSSRNRYLSAQERARALHIVEGLRAAHDAYRDGERDAEALRQQIARLVEPQCERVDYVAAVKPEDLTPLTGRHECLSLLVAAHVGSTRLIDNVELGHDTRP